MKGVFAAPEIAATRAIDGSLKIRSTAEFLPPERNVGAWLTGWAVETPHAPFLVERRARDWATLTYAEVAARAEAVAQAVIDRRLSADRPVAILSENGVDHALLALGCLTAGVPYASLPCGLALDPEATGEVQRMIDLLTPGLVFAADGDRFGPTIERVALDGAEVVVSTGGDPAWSRFASLVETQPTDDVAAVAELVGPETVANVLFSTRIGGRRHGVVQTHGMLCAGQVSLASAWPFVEKEPPVMIGAAPWSRPSGANQVLNLVLRNGGALHLGVDPEGAADVHPTIVADEPGGLDEIVDALGRRPDLVEPLLSRVRLVASLGQPPTEPAWERLRALLDRKAGAPIPLTTVWGPIETAGLALTPLVPPTAPDEIGVPPPGVEVKLVPEGPLVELRVRGPNVGTGYLEDPDASERIFDDEGFFRTGTAVRLVDGEDASAGLRLVPPGGGRRP